MNKTENTLAMGIRALGERSEYSEQGAMFLSETKTTLEVIEAVPQTPPLWNTKGEKHGIKYSVTLKNARGSYTFDFWGSIHEAEVVTLAEKVKVYGNTSNPEFFKLSDFFKEKTGRILPAVWMSLHNLTEKTRALIIPNPYTILACLTPMSADTFEDFCSDYGYDEDSRLAEKTYNALLTQDRAMRKLFTTDELEALNEIA